ncbi:hypothetical protein [Agarivorans sp. JK6]|uniref:hypothetical protein n=1 Tax=Agarivorans sp. JK6 TaxID=2997426 RepID=UPI00387327F6
MEVKCLGFSVSVDGGCVSLSELFTFFENEGCVVDANESNQRRFYFDTNSHDDYFKGLVVTVKDQKKFCRLTNENGGFQILVDNLQGDDKLLEFNFLIIHKVTGLGLYQHYYQSCSMNVFGKYLKRYHHQLKKALGDAEISTQATLEGSPLTEGRKQRIRKQFSGQLKFAPLVRQENLEAILKEYRKIKSFEFEYAYLDHEVRAATPLSGFVSRKIEKLSFLGDTSFKNSIAKAISAFTAGGAPKRGKVIVEDYDGESIPIKIFDMPDCFGVEDFDKLAAKLHGLDVDYFYSHEIFDDLIAVFESEEHEDVFGMELQQ